MGPVPAIAPAASGPAPHQRWQVIAHPGHPVAALLPVAPAGGGPPSATAVLLGTEFLPGDNALLLRAVADARRHRRRLVLIHLGAGGASLVRAATAEDPALRGLSIELPAGPPAAAVRAAVALARTDRSSVDELQVDPAGRITTARWRAVPLPAAPPPRPGREVVVITGGLGGLGIRAAAALARHHRLHPVLIDRRPPAQLGRPAARWLRCLAGGPTGVTVRTADLTAAGPVAAALTGLPGPVTTIIHCAGTLDGGAVSQYRAEDLAAAQAVKLTGLRHTLAGVDPAGLRNLVVFGSVLAEQAPHGLGGYALANELLRRAVLRWSTGSPETATVVAQWAIWAGAGRAHELGVVGQARRLGMAPIPLQPGLAALRRLLAWPAGPGHAARLRLAGESDENRNQRETCTGSPA